MENPTAKRMVATKKTWRYVKGTPDVVLVYEKGGEDVLIGYLNVDYVREYDWFGFLPCVESDLLVFA